MRFEDLLPPSHFPQRGSPEEVCTDEAYFRFFHWWRALFVCVGVVGVCTTTGHVCPNNTPIAYADHSHHHLANANTNLSEQCLYTNLNAYANTHCAAFEHPTTNEYHNPDAASANRDTDTFAHCNTFCHANTPSSNSNLDVDPHPLDTDTERHCRNNASFANANIAG